LKNSFIDKTLVYIKEKLWPKLLLGLIALVFLVALITFFIFSSFINTGNGGKNDTNFVVVNGQGLKVISTNLKTKNIISNDLLFMIYMKYAGLSGNIKAGDYILSPSMTPMQIADILSQGKVASRTITIPEGWTVAEIGTYLEKQGIVKKSDFVLASNKEYSYDFLSSKPADVGLEGFLFPDTYQISITADSESIIKTMLDNFGKKVTLDMRLAAKQTGFSLYETITLASVVEEEANKPADRKIVAGIFISRLNEDMMLQSDVTVAYALGEDRKELTAADISLDSPYNTYVVAGLPKGPISNPGLESISAVIYPEITDFRYFIAANDQIYYAKNIEEHNANVAKYLN